MTKLSDSFILTDEIYFLVYLTFNNETVIIIRITILYCGSYYNWVVYSFICIYVVKYH